MTMKINLPIISRMRGEAHLSEDSRMSVKVILVENRVVVSECFCETRQACCRDFLQSCLVRLVADSADINRHPIFRVTHGPSSRLMLYTHMHAEPQY